MQGLFVTNYLEKLGSFLGCGGVRVVGKGEPGDR